MTVVTLVNVSLSVVTLIIKCWAFGDSIIRSSAGFKAVDKLPKSFWVLVLGLSASAHVAVALLIGLDLSWMGFIGLIGIVVALVYIFGIRPQVIQYGGRRGGGGRSSSEGPYGPW